MFPQMYRVRQHFPQNGLENPTQAVRAAMESLALSGRLSPGMSVAVTAGSRGIARIDQVMRDVVAFLKAECQVRPFIIPAMGSHGGATAESQQRLLAGFGISEQSCGCPIRSSLDTVVVEHTAQGIPVHIDRFAWEADHILLVNRVKPHTDFTGPIQSGLVKMLLLGLGKYDGAQIYHRAFQDCGFSEVVPQIAARVIGTGKVLGGVALVENAQKQLSHVEGVMPDQILAREPELLQMAMDRMARLPVREIDLLLVDELGKDVSGTGMDTNVIGRKADDHRAAPEEYPKVRHIAVRGLTAATRGNATGIGIAEFCLQRVVAAMDEHATRVNCITSGHVTAAMTPLVYGTDEEMISAALRVIGLREPTEARMVWIRNTADLGQLACSAACLDQLQSRTNVTLESAPQPLPWTAGGMLRDLSSWCEVV